MARREMKELYGGFAAARWPRPADPAQADIEVQRWGEAASAIEIAKVRRFAEKLPDDDAGRALLAAVFGNSPYLTHIMLDDPDFAVDLLRRGPDALLADTFAALRKDFSG